MSFYDDASWVLIPEGIKEDVVYAQKPTNGLGDLTFTRASDATRTNSAGVIERTPWNLVTWSEVFSDVAWAKTGITVTPNVEVAPNGTLTADRIVFSSSNRALSNTTLLGTGVVCTGSFYVKGTAGETLLMAAGGLDTLFTLTGSWQRISTTKTSINSIINVSTFGGATARDIFLWGAQLVEGTDAKPYFATTNRQDVPRLDYRNADGTLNSCPRLLLEPQRTNLVPNGVLFNASTGVSYDSSITASPAPGVQNATRITKNEAAGNVRYANQNASATLLAGSSVYTLSRYFKYDGLDFQTTMEYNNSANWGGVAWFLAINISSTSITIGSPNACTATIVNMGSGWYRVTATITTGVTIVGAPTYLMRLPSTLSTGQGFLTALPQLELGAYATTFIPTTTAAVTRLVDNFTRSNIFTNGFITSAGGTWFVDLSNNSVLTRDGVATGLFLDTSNAGFTNGLNIRNSVGSARYNISKWQSGTGASLYTTLTDNVKIAIKWNGSTADVFVNGVKVVAGSAFTPTAMQFLNCNTAAGVPYFFNQSALFPVPMTDAQCIQLTT